MSAKLYHVEGVDPSGGLQYDGPMSRADGERQARLWQSNGFVDVWAGKGTGHLEASARAQCTPARTITNHRDRLIGLVPESMDVYAHSCAVAVEAGVSNTCDFNGESWAPLPLAKFMGRPEHDRSGQKKGLLKVIGRSPEPPTNKLSRSGALWVVRCRCGSYSRRRTKSLKNGKPDACTKCREAGHLMWKT